MMMMMMMMMMRQCPPGGGESSNIWEKSFQSKIHRWQIEPGPPSPCFSSCGPGSDVDDFDDDFNNDLSSIYLLYEKVFDS